MPRSGGTWGDKVVCWRWGHSLSRECGGSRPDVRRTTSIGPRRKARGWRDNEDFEIGDRWRGDKRAVASRHGGPFERGMGMDFYF